MRYSANSLVFRRVKSFLKQRQTMYCLLLKAATFQNAAKTKLESSLDVQTEFNWTSKLISSLDIQTRIQIGC